MDGGFANPTLLGVIAVLISTIGTGYGLYLNAKKDARAARRDDLARADERILALETKVAARDKLVDEQAEIIRKLRDELADSHRALEEKDAEIHKLKRRVTALENKAKK